MEKFLNKLAVKFTRPEKVMEHKQKFGTLKTLDISLENQKADENLSVGLVTRGQLRKLLNEGDIDISDVDKFYDGVRRFYIAAFTYCKKCVFIDFNERNKRSMDNVEGVLSSLGHIHRDVINIPRAMDTLEEEFLVYQAVSEADIPAHI